MGYPEHHKLLLILAKSRLRSINAYYGSVLLRTFYDVANNSVPDSFRDSLLQMECIVASRLLRVYALLHSLAAPPELS